uniref:Uncharacterized protein n=1 Tax=Setaria italica TaxID=4555 RepID=K3XTT1_SETIT
MSGRNVNRKNVESIPCESSHYAHHPCRQDVSMPPSTTTTWCDYLSPSSFAVDLTLRCSSVW